MTTENDLIIAIKDTLENDGSLKKFKAEMRTKIMDILNAETTAEKPHLPRETLLLNELIREYLTWNGYKYTKSVFVQESGLSSEPISRSQLLDELGVCDTEDSSKLTEQNIIDGWLSKLTEIDESDESQAALRNEYLRTLERLIRREKRLLPPFNNVPPEGDLVPLSEISGRVMSFQIKKMPCPKPKRIQDTGAIPKSKSKKVDRSQPFESSRNEFEDPEEMAKVIARSKGQLFPEFVASIARHTSDYGQALNQCMKFELSSFRDYVDSVLSQRVKDLTEVLDEEQNRELKRIKKDIERWQLELNNVKRRIKEIIPDFDMEDYKKHPNYLEEIFSVELIHTDDAFENWKEETSHRIKWITETACKTAQCNEQKNQAIADICRETSELESSEAAKQQNHLKFIHCEIADYRKLKCERDALQRQYLDMLSEMERTCNFK